MLQTIPALRLPTSRFVRNPDQRAALGRFCVGASALLLPPRIVRRAIGKFQISYFLRRLFGFDIPVAYVLVEQDSASGSTDIRQAAEAANLALADERSTDIIKLYLASSARADETGKISDGYGSAFFPLRIPEAIELGNSYEQFLHTLGPHTRRDMRRLRRKADDLGLTFACEPATQTGAGERYTLGDANHPRPYRARQIDRVDGFVAAQETGFHTLLRSSSGELLSCCAGFISDGCAIVLYQLNHGAYRKASLSLTHRSFIIELLIAGGTQELLFPGGAAGLLSTACRTRESGDLVLIRQSAAAMIKSAAIMAVRPKSCVGTAFRKIVSAQLTVRLDTQPRTSSP
jgi:hypothetical protein